LKILLPTHPPKKRKKKEEKIAICISSMGTFNAKCMCFYEDDSTTFPQWPIITLSIMAVEDSIGMGSI